MGTKMKINAILVVATAAAIIHYSHPQELGTPLGEQRTTAVEPSEASLQI